MFRKSLWAYGVGCLEASAKYSVGFVALKINRKDHFSVEWSAVFPNISVDHKDKTLPKKNTKSLPRTKRLIQDWFNLTNERLLLNNQCRDLFMRITYAVRSYDVQMSVNTRECVKRIEYTQVNDLL